MSEHTPGPWAYEAHGDTGDYGVGVLIDPCGDNDDQCTGEQITGVMIVAETVAVEVKGQANARLIAAAPDMYEALERAERKLMAYVGVCKDDKELTDTVLPMITTALAKVRP